MINIKPEEQDQLFRALVSSEKMLKELIEGKTSSAERLVRLDLAVGALQKEVGEILSLVRGRDGFEVKVSLIEDKLQRIQQTNTEGTRGRWLAVSSLITGVMSVVAVAVALTGKR